MSDIAAITLAIVVVNIVLVVVTIVYITIVYKQLRHSRLSTLQNWLQQVESDITQLRIMDAQLADNRGAAREKLYAREKECKKTIDRITKLTEMF